VTHIIENSVTLTPLQQMRVNKIQASLNNLARALHESQSKDQWTTLEEMLPPLS
jgi:uncharacterized coiled-coil protein SlyX